MGGKPMKLRGVVAICLTAVLLAGCGGTKPAAKSALQGMDDVLKAGKSAPLDDLSRQSDDLRNLPEDYFSKEDLARRNTLLRRSETLMLDLTVLGIDSAVLTQKAANPERANLIRQKVLSTATTWNQKFVKDFQEVTEEIITDVACGQILDQIAPDQKPEDPGADTPAESAAQEAVDKLVLRQWPTGYQHLVNWTSYIASVTTDANQFAQAIDGFSTLQIAALGNPGVRKAVVVYLRTCYSPPKPFPAS
jgi:hypothetical protein